RGGDQDRYRFVAVRHPALHPGQSAQIEKAGVDGQWHAVGLLGALNPSVQKQLGIRQPLYLAQLYLNAVREIRVPRFHELSKFPQMRRDLALVVAHDVAVEQVLAGISIAASEFLTKLNLFDVYVG